MGDFLLDIASNSSARRVLKTLGLPIPMPTRLRRASGPWQDRPLDGDSVVVAAGQGGLGGRLCAAASQMGAAVTLAGETDAEGGGAVSQQVPLDSPPETLEARALVFDASGMEDPAELRRLHTFFHPWLRRLGRCGRVIVVGRSATSHSRASAAACSAALDGFVRSVAKEIGKHGSTANLVYVDPGAEQRLEPVVRWLLSERSAFVTGQPVHVSGYAVGESPEQWTRPLEGQVALVTGAARGIGAATAERLAEEGAQVVCLDRPEDSDAMSEVASRIGGHSLLVDVADPHAPQHVVEELDKRHGGVDVVVHNAGVTRDKTLGRMDADKWNQTLGVNLGAVVRMTDALLEGPLRDRGRIVCLSSVAGLAGNAGQTNYAASKAGIAGLVRHLGPHLAERGITANAVAPGFIETRMTAAMPATLREAARRMSALGQGGDPVDVAEAITFLSSPGAHGVTGQVVRVCGGAFLGA